MRVTFIMKRPGLEGGVRVAAVYAAALRAGGHEVEVVATQKEVKGWKSRLKRFLVPGLSSKVYPPLPNHFEATGVPVRYVASSGPITARDVPDADVVVATWWETAEWVAALPGRKGVPVYLIQHDERVFSHLMQTRPQRIEATWRLPMTRVAVAQWLADLLDDHGATPTTVVPNAVDTGLFHAPPRGKRAVPTVGYMHSIVDFKGADVMKAAVQIARRSVPDLRVVSFGHTEAGSGVGVPEGTAYHQSPPQEMLHEIYASCDAWLFGSRCEGFGLPILEAMACRTPVIGVPTGAAPQLIDDARGRLVEMDDPEAMAQRIVELVRSSDADWRAMSENAHAAATGYTWDDAARAFEAVLLDAVEKGGQDGQAGPSQSGGAGEHPGPSAGDAPRDQAQEPPCHAA